MAKHSRLLLTVGAVLVILGSFLPWMRHDTFVGIVSTRGIELYWVPAGWSSLSLRFEDNGGILTALLGLVTAVLFLRPPRFIRRSENWALVCAAILVIVSLYHRAMGWLMYMRTRHVRDGMSYVGAGLYVVILGSSLILVAALIEVLTKQTKNAA
jgi:hypothetical protein